MVENPIKTNDLEVHPCQETSIVATPLARFAFCLPSRSGSQRVERATQKMPWICGENML